MSCEEVLTFRKSPCMTIGGGWVGLELGAGGARPGDAVMSGTSLPLSWKRITDY